MKRMRTLFLYFFGIVGFIIFSLIIEDSLVRGMYKKVKPVGAEIDSSYGVTMENVEVDATSMNGNMTFTLKLDLISDRNNTAITHYIEVPELEPGESKNYQIKFKGNNIKSYKVAMQDSLPNKENMIDVFGWEFDVRNVFGLDLSNVKIMGVPIKELFSWEKAKTGGKTVLAYTIGFLNQIPWWGYAIGAFIVYVNLPSGFILGII